jgi:hypothetical protein
MDSPLPVDTQGQYLGNSPDIQTPSLEVEQRVITSYGQAQSVIQNMREDAKILVLNSARIINVINGRRPNDQKKLNDQNRGWRSNVNTGFLTTQIAKLIPRYVQPIATAKYLTAAELPAFTEEGTPWPNGTQKTEWYRECITDFIRRWPQWNLHIEGMAREVGSLGYCFNAYFDEWEWKPKLIRMDKGFVPKGTEVLDEPQFFAVEWLYKPHELLALLKANKEAGRKEWNEEACVKAINDATAPAVNTTMEVEFRSYADLLRQGAYRNDYTKGYKVIATYHLFAREATGKVSHYVVLRDDQSPASDKDENKFLYEKEDAYETMSDSCIPTVFDFGDGTVHGSWGAGQRLFDLAARVEKSRNEAQDNLALSTKQRFQVPEAKNINQVKVQVIDDMIISSGATFAQNVGGIAANTEAYVRIGADWERFAQELIGQYVPPIPLQASDIKAAQVNAAMQKEEEQKSKNLLNWLSQFAVLTKAIERRVTRKDSPLKEVKALRKKLLLKLTEEEIETLREQPPTQTIIEFTEYRAVQRAQFAQSVIGNQLFNQQYAAQAMAMPLGNSFMSAIVMNDQANNEQVIAQQRMQIIEANVMMSGGPVPVVATDNSVVHYDTLKGIIVQSMEGGAIAPERMRIMLNHLQAHWVQATSTKSWDGAKGNEEKSFIASVDKAINESIAAKQNAQAAIAAQQAQQQPQAMPMQPPA